LTKLEILACSLGRPPGRARRRRDLPGSDGPQQHGAAPSFTLRPVRIRNPLAEAADGGRRLADNRATRGPTMRPRSIASVLDHAAELERFMPLVDRLITLRAAVRAVMPRELADCATVVALKHDTVWLLADNAAVAAKLRVLEPTLLRALQRLVPQAAAVRVRVRTVASAGSRRREKRACLDPGPAAALAALADALPASPLREAVASLSRKGRR
jgi:hypothetical protein